MQYDTKTVYLSNAYPQGGINSSGIYFNVAGKTKVLFDLSKVDKGIFNGLGITKTYVNFGDGNVKYYESIFNPASEIFLPPAIIEHTYVVTTTADRLDGVVDFFYSNGYTSRIELSAYVTQTNLIDIGLQNTENQLFISGNMKKIITFATKNNDLFNDGICFLKNIDFKDIWENEKTDNSIKDTIWDYLQTLYLIGETIISDSNKIKSLVESLKKKRNNEPINDADSEENKDLMNMLQNLSEKKEPINFDENMLNNGLIGNLAKELAGDINLDDMNLNLDNNEGEMPNIGDIFGKLMSGNNPMKFMNLIQNVGQKIQTKLSDGNLDQAKLLDEAQNMMGMLGNNNPLFDSLLGNAKKEMTQNNTPNYNNNPTADRLRKKMEARKNKK